MIGKKLTNINQFSLIVFKQEFIFIDDGHSQVRNN